MLRRTRILPTSIRVWDEGFGGWGFGFSDVGFEVRSLGLGFKVWVGAYWG